VFTYDVGTTTVDMTGFLNDAGNFDVTALDETWTVGNLSLTDDEAGTIYLTGLSGGNLIGEDVLGDANGDDKIDHLDLELFGQQFGLKGHR